MPWVKLSNGSVVKVTSNSILLKNNPVVSAPTTPVNNYTNSQGQSSYVPPSTPVSISVTVPVVNSSSSVTITKTDIEKRRDYVGTLILSTTPEIAVIQKKAQEEYVLTGKWNDMYTKQADAIRSGLNPMYPGGGLGFNESQYILPGGSNTPTLDAIGETISNVVGGGASTLGGMTGSTTGMIAIGFFIVMMWGRG